MSAKEGGAFGALATGQELDGHLLTDCLATHSCPRRVGREGSNLRSGGKLGGSNQKVGISETNQELVGLTVDDRTSTRFLKAAGL